MQQFALGTSSLNVSAVGLGTWAMGGTAGDWGRVDDRESIAAIHQAIDLGITLIDTAPFYGLGHAEEIVGLAIRSRRDEVVLASKCGLRFPVPAGGPPTRCLARQSILHECEESLRRLRTDVIDLYQCHWPDPNTPLLETMEAMMTLRDQGKIRAIGLANFGSERLSAAREFGCVHSLQVSFSPLNQRAGYDLLPDCNEHGTGFLACSPLAKGLFSGTRRLGERYGGIRARDPEFFGKRLTRNLETVEAMRHISGRYDKTVAQLAINWVIGQPGVTAAVFGAKRPSQVVENAGAVDWTLTDEDRNYIEGLAREERP